MKSALIFLTFLGLAFGGKIPTRNLQDDLNDFLALIPVDQVLAIALDYLANDAQVQETMAYLQSDEFHNIITTLEDLPEFKNFIGFLRQHGLEPSDFLNTFHALVGLGPYTDTGARSTRRGVGVNGLITDIIAVLPIDQLQALFQEKLTTSPDFKAFYDTVRGPEFQSILAALRELPEYQNFLDKLNGFGVDTDHYILLARDLFGVPSNIPPTRNLQDDLNDFLALIPIDQVLAIALDYLANDAQVQEFMNYLQSDDFHSIISSLEALPEFKNFIGFLRQHGLEPSDFLNTFHAIVGLGPYTDTGARSTRRGVGVNGLITDLIAVLPLDALQALFQEKLTTSPDFKAFYDTVRGPEFQGLLGNLRANPFYISLLDTLRTYGVDVDYYIQFLRDLFGVSSNIPPTRNLQDDLNDFLALIPIDQVLAIALDYLANDAQVQEFMNYLQSDDFHSIISSLEALPEFKNFIGFLRQHGLEPSDFLNTFHALVGLGPYTDTGARSTRRGVGVNGLITDLIAVLPLDALQALFQEKLTTSPDFKAFYDTVRGPEFQGLLGNLRANPFYISLLDTLRTYGVDVDYYIQFLRDLFGVSSNIPPTRNLQDDLNDFLALIPIDQVLAIALDYLANDAQVQEFMNYLQSDDFHSIISSLEALPEFKNFIGFLRQHGLEPSDFLNTFHALVGLGPYTDTGARSTRRGVGVNGLITDLIAVLPLDALQALFQEKLTTSPDFKAFYDTVRGPEFQGLLGNLRANPFYISLLDTLRTYGVDVDYYIQFLRDLFGVSSNIPPTRNLQDDLNDFLALIPIDQVLAIALDYLANDAQVQEFMNYLQSDDFHSIISSLEALPEFKNFIGFLRQHGLEPSDFLNTFHAIVGLGPYTDTGARSTRRGVGVNGLITDLIAVLPLDALQALFQEKLTTSPDFKAFYDTVRGPEFQGLLGNLRANPFYISLLDTLRTYGVDVDYYIQFLRDLFGVSSNIPPTRNLQDDLNDFLALIPIDQVLAIALDYLANDAQVQEFMNYLQSDDFHSIISSLEALPEFKNFIGFLRQHGLEPSDFLNTFHALVGLGPYTDTGARSTRRGVGVNGLITDLIAVLPLDALQALFQEKLTTSPDFKAFYDTVRGPEFQGLLGNLRANPFYISLLDTLRTYGVDVDYYIQFLRDLFGVSSNIPPTRNLQDDLNDFLALIPIDQVLAIALDYLANDAQVQEFMNYLQSDDFHSIISSLEALPEFKNFIGFLRQHGLEPSDFLNTFHALVGLGPYTDTGARSTRRGVGVNGLITDLIAVLPLDALQALFQEKLTTSPDFKAFYDTVRGPEFQGLLGNLRANPFYISLLDTLRTYGVDVDYYIQFLRDLFGVSSNIPPTRNLQDDLNDFLALIPIDQVLAIALDYLANDAQVQEFMNYLQSDDFHSIISSLEALPEFKNFIGFLRQHGLEPSDFLNTFHALVGLGPYTDTGARSTRRGVGVNGLITDLIAVLPLDALQALFQEKLTTSPDFKAFYDTVRGPEFQGLLGNLRANPFYISLLDTLRTYGVDVDYYIQFLRDLFGVSSNIPPTRNLQDDLNDFLALIPIDQVLAIALDYLANDAQVQEFMNYLQSDDFHSIISSLEALPEFKNFIGFLRQHGLEPSDFLNTFHALVGLGPYTDTGARSTRRGVGVNGLITDLIAVLPLDALQALFQEKLTTSPDFKAFYDTVRGPEFQGLLGNLRANPFYISLLDTLRTYGVDVDYYIQFLRDLFGVSSNIPPTRNLQDDLNDFLALIPIDQVLAIALDYLANDAQVQEFMNYLQSDDFHSIISSLEALPEFKNFIGFLRQHGLEPSDFLNTFHAIVGLGPYTDTGARSTRRGVGVNGLITDLIAVLPLDALQALFQEKLTTSPDFKAFYDTVRGPEFQGLLGNLRANPFYISLLDTLRTYGVDVDYYIQFLRDLFGVSSNIPPTRNLQDDLNDFLALIPIDQVLAIALDYLANDAQVQEFMNYLQSDDFHSIISSLEALPEFKNFIGFLRQHGLEPSDFLNTFHAIVGLGPYTDTGARSTRRGVGVNGLITDLIAVLPLDALQALFQEKLTTSPDFKAFYDTVRGPEFQGLLGNLRANPFYISLLDTLRTYGVDVDYYIQFLRDLFGVSSNIPPTRNLQDDLNDFLALIPIDQVLAIALDYLANDAQVQELMNYLQSDEFHNIITTLEGLPEFKNFIGFLRQHGLEPSDFINTIHTLVGLGPYIDTGARSTRRGVGVNGLITDIIAVLPIDQLQALFQEKLTTSPDFKALYDAIRGPEFQSIVAVLRELPEYQDLLSKLREDFDVNTDYYIQIIRGLFNIE